MTNTAAIPASPPPAKASSKLPPFDWADPLLLAGQLSEEERMVYDMAKRFADEELLPGVLEANRNQTFDRAIYRKMGDAGFLGLGLEGGTGTPCSHRSSTNHELTGGSPDVAHT